MDVSVTSLVLIVSKRGCRAVAQTCCDTVRMASTGQLILAATPLGDPRDASVRLRELLATADVVAAEDTRRTRRLADDLGVTIGGRLVSYYDAVEVAKGPELIAEMQAGHTVLVVTDAGMPSVSDPGYRLVAAAVDAGIKVTSAPGPSAVTTALALSGLPCDRFTFEGFLPRKAGERRTRLDELSAERRTMVFFEAPHRIEESLAAMAEVFGADRPAAVCRELTKTYEEVKRGGLGDLAEWSKDGVRGEITVVVSGAEPVVSTDPADLVATVFAREEAGIDRRTAIADVAREAGVPKREVYDAVLAAKRKA